MLTSSSVMPAFIHLAFSQMDFFSFAQRFQESSCLWAMALAFLFVLSYSVMFSFYKVFAQLLCGILLALTPSFVQGMLLCLVLGVFPGTSQGTLCFGDLTWASSMHMLFVFIYGPNSAQRLLLTLCSWASAGGLRGPFGVPEFKPRPSACKASHPTHYTIIIAPPKPFIPFVQVNIWRQIVVVGMSQLYFSGSRIKAKILKTIVQEVFACQFALSLF